MPFIRSGKMRRHLRRAGFEQVRAAGLLRDPGPTAPLAAYCVVAARRPG